MPDGICCLGRLAKSFAVILQCVASRKQTVFVYFHLDGDDLPLWMVCPVLLNPVWGDLYSDGLVTQHAYTKYISY